MGKGIEDQVPEGSCKKCLVKRIGDCFKRGFKVDGAMRKLRGIENIDHQLF